MFINFKSWNMAEEKRAFELPIVDISPFVQMESRYPLSLRLYE